MTTVHFIYSYSAESAETTPEAGHSPYSITWHVSRMLRKFTSERGWAFNYVNLDDNSNVLHIAPEDIVIGHPWWGVPNAPMNLALDFDVRLKIILMPFTPFNTTDHDLLISTMDKADRRMLIMGPYWWGRMQSTPYVKYLSDAHTVRMDMAVNPALHPHCKTTWNPPGKRKVLLLGHDQPYKGNDIAVKLCQMAGAPVIHVGSTDYDRKLRADDIFANVPALKRYGGRVLTPDFIQKLCDECDIFLATGRYDANPTTLLETACWGLMGLSSPYSGYHMGPFERILTDGELDAVETLNHWLTIPTYKLVEAAQKQHKAVTKTDAYTWDTFTGKIRQVLLEAIEESSNV